MHPRIQPPPLLLPILIVKLPLPMLVMATVNGLIVYPLIMAMERAGFNFVQMLFAVSSVSWLARN